MNSWTQKFPNFEIFEGVPIKTRVPREVMFFGNYGNCIPHFTPQKNNAFSKRTRLLMNFNAFTVIFSLMKQGYLFSEPIYYML